MWSVVTESPTMTSTRAFSMSDTSCALPRSWKNGGSCTPVDFGSHSYVAPVGDGMLFQKRSPTTIFTYSVAYISCVIADSLTLFASLGVDQMSFRNTCLP